MSNKEYPNDEVEGRHSFLLQDWRVQEVWKARRPSPPRLWDLDIPCWKLDIQEAENRQSTKGSGAGISSTGFSRVNVMAYQLYGFYLPFGRLVVNA